MALFLASQTAQAAPVDGPARLWHCSKLSLPDPALSAAGPQVVQLFSADCTRSATALKMPPQISGTGVVPPSAGVAQEHHFFDRENGLLFAAVGASRTLDYFSTLNFRRRGRDEIFLTNDIVDNHAAFAAIEAGATAVSIGASYLLHRYHHHRLERWTSIVHAGLATSGSIRNYCLKTARH